MGSTSTSQVFALIIGISEYKSPDIPNLRGAVNDANSMKSYVSDVLQAPASHISFLSDKSATRSAIISAFKTLIANPKIKENATIIIFYAGHGSRPKAPDGWITSDGQIETLLPYDVDGISESIHSIPDRTIMALLRRLADAKGNNITVIFDCCHSGGLTRDIDNEAVRSVTLPYVIPETLDEEIWSPELARGGQPKLGGFRFHAMSSHVLLAACREKELAYEYTVDKESHGFFTQGLIQQFCEIKTHMTTYSAVIDSLVNTFLEQGRSQKPQCEGTNKDRAVFNGQLAGKLNAFTLTQKEGHKTFEVGAGYIQEVVSGTEFVVQKQKPGSVIWEDLGHMEATTVNASSSTLVPRGAKFPVPKGAVALVSNWKNELKVFVYADSEEREKLESEIDRDQSPQKAFVRVGRDCQADAHVVIKLESHGKDRVLHIERKDGLMSRYAKELRVGLPPTLPPALDQIAHFNYHLGRYRGEGSLQRVARSVHDPLGNVSMKLYRLVAGTEGFQVPGTEDLLVDNEAKLKLDEDAEYGIEIINNTGHDLFPYLFYFDPSDYIVQSWYLPPSLTMDAPLRRLQGRVTVGYSAGGGDPIAFTLKRGEESDTGFLKLFVSTRAADMSAIAQELPFKPPFMNKSGRGGGRKAKDDINWSVVVAAIIVSR